MPAPTQMKHFAEIAALLRERRLIVAGVLLLAFMLLVGPFVLKPEALEIFSGRNAGSSWRDPSWAGGLESPRSQQAVAEQRAEKPMTSASYTSGFDEKAAGLGPLPPEHPVLRLAQPRNALACPDDLNCSFRPAKGALPPRRPAAIASLKHVKTATQQPNGLFLPLLRAHLTLPTPHLSLPSADTLLTPFTYVSNTVVGFVKKM